MSEALRALVVVLVLSTTVVVLARRPATELAVTPGDFDRRRNAWFAVTAIAFVSYNFWLFAALAGLITYVVGRKEANPTAMFMWLLFAVPSIMATVPGFGIINYLMQFDYVRLLTLTLLLPVAVRLWKVRKAEGRAWLLPDVLLLIYLLIQLGLRYQVDSATNTARYGVYALIDVVLPYYVASRSLRSVQQFRDMAMSFVVACMILSILGLFEAVKWWLLYSPLERTWGLSWGYGNYMGRSSLLRAQVSTGQPIVLGYVIMVGLALHCYLRHCIRNRSLWWLGFLLLLGGLTAALSRGPWVGAVVALLVFLMTGPRALGGVVKGVLGAGIVFSIVLMTPLGDKVIGLLPFVGTVDAENVDYRRTLLEVGTRLIMNEPWFGVSGYMSALVANELVIGGMVDVVNTYLGIGLAYGVPALLCFVGVFVVIAWRAYAGMLRLGRSQEELRWLGSGLLGALAGIGVTIFTTSSISVIPVVYWMVAGAGCAYVQLLRREAADRAVAVPDPRVVRPRYTRVGIRTS